MDVAAPRGVRRLPLSTAPAAWRAKLLRLAEREKRTPWELGDHLVLGERVHGVTYRQATRLAGLGYGTLRNYASVAARFDVSVRYDALTFRHHAEVAACDADAADDLLALAQLAAIAIQGKPLKNIVNGV